ncbi:Calmodulin [Tritrichomonas foetus]|uniref:Calmodulin n=1 Tax=Tritrichomonas foetus TaxID=1144522 RepID=A0A1J4JXH9_9EUKA|nr:Calmodulin [Tritrichomonas foetus]|eukprot:OHT02238.1 Calmodulin [Tritrichomonas foetus]
MGVSESYAHNQDEYSIYLKRSDLGYREAFEIFDINNDHTISKKELKAVYRSLGLTNSTLDEDFQREASNSFCTNDNTEPEIDYQRFKSLLESKLKEKELNEKIGDAFQIFDRENKGMISKNQLKYLLLNTGDPLTTDEVDEFLYEISKSDICADGTNIDYRKFANKMVE